MGRRQEDYGQGAGVYTYDRANESALGWVNYKEDVPALLTRCPLCKGTDFTVIHNWELNYFAKCNTCGLTGPLSHTPRQVLHTWLEGYYHSADRVSSYLPIDYFECRFCGKEEYYESNGKFICARCRSSIPIWMLHIRRRLSVVCIDKTPVMQTRFYHVLGHTKDTGERVHYYKHRYEEEAIRQLVQLSKKKSNILYHIEYIGEENG